MRVLVTGDRGYLGSVLVPMLQRAGHSVVGVDAGHYAGCAPGTPAPRYEQRSADAFALQPSDFAGFDGVIHLAGGQSGQGQFLPLTNRDYQRVDDQVVGAQEWLAPAVYAKEAGVQRFIYPAVSDLVDAEIDIWAPLAQLLELRTGPNFIPIVLSGAAPYGFSPCMRLDTLLNAVVAHALVHKRARLPDMALHPRPYAHVKDVARALIAALHVPANLTGSGRFDLVRRRDIMPIAAVMSYVASITGAHVSLPHNPIPPVPILDLATHPRLPGFTRRFQLPEGLRELCRGLTRRELNAQMLTGTPLLERSVLRAPGNPIGASNGQG